MHMISDEVFRIDLDAALKKQGLKKAARNKLIAMCLAADPATRDEILEREETKARDFQANLAEGKWVPLESEEQIRFVDMFRRTYPLLKIIYIHNGGSRTRKEKQEQLLLGLCPGASDLCIPIPNGCIWLEMKRTKGHDWGEDQKKFALYVEKMQGHYYVIGYGAEDAFKKIVDLLT